MGLCDEVLLADPCQIKMKSDSSVVCYTSRGITFADGTELDADVIVLATGFDISTKNRVRDYLGDDVADGIDDFAEINDEGELSGAWRFQREYFELRVTS